MNTRAVEESSRLDGQVALVTGGGRGIGRAIAQAFAAAGAAVAVIARTANELNETVRLIADAGGRSLSFPADVTNPEAVRGTIQSIESALGPVDVLVNNAAVVKPFAPFWETETNEWWRGMEVNMLGPLLCARWVLPGMVARGKGRIINVASRAGVMATPFYSSYGCSKTALIRFSECLALETAPHGVAIFSISPGTVRTAMSEYSLNSEEGKKWLPWFRRILDEHLDVPAERPAQLVLALASGRFDKLSGRFITISDDLDGLLQNSNEVEERNLHALKLENLAGAAANPALASILSEARRAAK